MDALTLAVNSHGVRLCYARRKSQSWPGWACPLNAPGYWVGTDKRHTALGDDFQAVVATWVEDYGGQLWFGAKLRTLREEAGWTVQELAEAASLSRQVVHNYETGTQRPTWDSVQKLAAALKVSTDVFRDKE